MRPERRQLYENAQWLVDRLESESINATLDPITGESLAGFLSYILAELYDTDGIMFDEYPALERWRRLATLNTARRAPLDVAAAWELTAIRAENDEAVTIALEHAHGVAA